MDNKDLNALSEAVRTKITDGIISVLPEATVKEMISKEIIRFLEKDLPTIINHELKASCGEFVKRYIEYKGHTIYDPELMKYKISELAKETGPALMEGFFSVLAQNMISNSMSVALNNASYTTRNTY